MLQCGLVRLNLAFDIAAAFYEREDLNPIQNAQNAGAGDGNRTHVASLEGWSSTIELHPPCKIAMLLDLVLLPAAACLDRPIRGDGGGGRIRTFEDVRRQIYSLLPLTARQPLRDRFAARRSGV